MKTSFTLAGVVVATCAVATAIAVSKAEETSSGTTYYFSSSIGNDDNACTQASPCQTISKVNSLSYNGGDTVAFRAGDTWTLTTSSVRFLGSNNHVGAQNVHPNSQTFTITTYGSGSCRPLAALTNGCATFQLGDTSSLTAGFVLINLANTVMENVVVIGGTTGALRFHASSGIYITNSGGNNANVTVRNVEVQDYALLINVQVQAGALRDLSILDNYLRGSSPGKTVDMGIYASGSINGGLIEGNLITNIGGHDSSASGYYSGGSGNGILIANGATGITDQFNITSNFGANINSCGGPAGNWTYIASHTTIQFNESYGGVPSKYTAGCDWDGFDIDAGSSDVIVQYNYSHGNYGAAFNAYITNEHNHNWERNVIRYNISENDGQNPSTGFGGVTIGGAANTSTASAIYNNTLSSNNDGRAGGFCLYILVNNDVLFANNICYNNGEHGNALLLYTGFDEGAMTLVNNDYYRVNGSGAMFGWAGAFYATLAAFQAGTAKDNGSIGIDPKLTPTGDRESCYSSGIPVGPQPCPRNYAVHADSAVVGAGLDLTKAPYGLNPGKRDYYGNAIPHSVGSGYNIGAYGGNP
jgi:hypothetical protein